MLLDRTAHMRADDAGYGRHLEEVLAADEPSGPSEIIMRDGRTVTEMVSLISGGNPDQPIGWLWIYEDITRQKLLKQELIQLFERDPLTNLYNRRRFHEKLECMIADASRRRAQADLLAIELDNLTAVNDKFGYQPAIWC